jgi:hypothetical protein
LTNTNDPTGSDSLLTIQVDGTASGDVATYSGMAPSVPITISAATATAAPEMDAGTALAALTLLVGMIAVVPGRRIEETDI